MLCLLHNTQANYANLPNPPSPWQSRPPARCCWVSPRRGCNACQHQAYYSFPLLQYRMQLTSARARLRSGPHPTGRRLSLLGVVAQHHHNNWGDTAHSFRLPLMGIATPMDTPRPRCPHYLPIHRLLFVLAVSSPLPLGPPGAVSTCPPPLDEEQFVPLSPCHVVN